MAVPLRESRTERIDPAAVGQHRAGEGESISLTEEIRSQTAGACQTPLPPLPPLPGEPASPPVATSPTPIPSRLKRMKGFRPGGRGEPHPPIPPIFKALWRKPSRRQHELALRLEKLVFEIFDGRGVVILADLAAQRLMQLPASLFSPGLASDIPALDEILTMAVSIMMEREPLYRVEPGEPALPVEHVEPATTGGE